MEKKKNNYFKAVSIISLICAIIMCIIFAFILVAALSDFQKFIESFEQVLLTETGGVPGSATEEILIDAQGSAVATLVMMSLYFVGYIVVCFLAYVKIKKYSLLTNEEANKYSRRIIAWVIVMFVCSGLVMGILMLCGYLNITKVQIEEYQKNQQATFNVQQTEAQQPTDSVDLNIMKERLEKLKEIKEMGGLSEEEYENLRRAIVEGKK